MGPDSYCFRMNTEFIKATRNAEMEPSPGPLLEGLMKDAEFVNIHHQRNPLPVGTWPADKHLVSHVNVSWCRRRPMSYEGQHWAGLRTSPLTNHVVYRKRSEPGTTSSAPKVLKRSATPSSLAHLATPKKRLRSSAPTREKSLKIQSSTPYSTCTSAMARRNRR